METYQGPERRSERSRIDRRILNPGQQAVLAIERRFGGEKPADLAAQQFSAGVKEEIQRIFNLLKGKITPEQMKLSELVKGQYGRELALLKESGIYCEGNDMPPPDAEAASQILLTKLSPVQVEVILKMAKKPQLQLEAFTSFSRYTAALNANKKMPRQIDTYVNPNMQKKLAVQDEAAGIGNTVTGWRVGIIDVAQELKVDPDLKGKLGDKRTQAQAKLKSQGLRLVHPRRYALAQLRAIQQGRPLDVQSWSVLDDDTGDTSVVPGGRWDFDLVYLVGRDPGSDYASARFRPEVVANM